MERIVLTDNLQEAWLRAARGKRDRAETRRFESRLEAELSAIQHDLLKGTYHFGGYRRFTVWDPKQRTICAASMRDRVTMHAMMRICHPVFEAYQVYDSYASRIGKGTYAALDRAQALGRRYRWFAKLDVVKYFDSISHHVLWSQLLALFKDPRLLSLWRQLIEGYHTAEGRGLPIGNLTSQYFANHYLAGADHRLHEVMHVEAATRYMDDILLFDNDPKRLKDITSAYIEHVGQTLSLSLHTPHFGLCDAGIPFLGYVLLPGCRRLNGRSRHRFRHRVAALTQSYMDGRLTDDDYRCRLTSVYAFVRHADSRPLMRRIICEQGCVP